MVHVKACNFGIVLNLRIIWPFTFLLMQLDVENLLGELLYETTKGEASISFDHV